MGHEAIFVGYGFNTSKISADQWMEILQEYNPEKANELKDECRNVQQKMQVMVTNKICELADTPAEYLAEIINRQARNWLAFENFQDDIVRVYGRFICFASLRFEEEAKRGKYIRNRSQFQSLIARFLDVSKLEFGNVVFYGYGEFRGA